MASQRIQPELPENVANGVPRARHGRCKIAAHGRCIEISSPSLGRTPSLSIVAVCLHRLVAFSAKSRSPPRRSTSGFAIPGTLIRERKRSSWQNPDGDLSCGPTNAVKHAESPVLLSSFPPVVRLCRPTPSALWFRGRLARRHGPTRHECSPTTFGE